MSARGRDEYRRSLFDKHGPEAADHMRAVSSLIIPVVDCVSGQRSFIDQCSDFRM